jgi:hypothetical protein
MNVNTKRIDWLIWITALCVVISAWAAFSATEGYAAAGGGDQVEIAIPEYLDISGVSSVTISGSASGGVGTFTGTDEDVIIKSNKANGYQVGIKVGTTSSAARTDSTPNLILSTVTTGTSAAADEKIEPYSGATSSIGYNKYGVLVSNKDATSTFGTTYIAPSYAGETLVDQTTHTDEDGDKYAIKFDVKFNNAITEGTYSNQVTYTVTARAA